MHDNTRSLPLSVLWHAATRMGNLFSEAALDFQTLAVKTVDPGRLTKTHKRFVLTSRMASSRSKREISSVLRLKPNFRKMFRK